MGSSAASLSTLSQSTATLCAGFAQCVGRGQEAKQHCCGWKIRLLAKIGV